MAAIAQAALVPMLSPMRVATPAGHPVRYHRPRPIQPQHLDQRLQRPKQYARNGYNVLQNRKGRLIDLYA